MGNELNELNDQTMEQGHDVNVIAKQLPITVGTGSKVFEVILWCLALIPGLIFLFAKIKAQQELSQLQQKIQQAASSIDNYLEQRVVILKNAAAAVEKSIKTDKETFTAIAGLRSGNMTSTDNADAARNELNSVLDDASRKINVAFENYPQLKSQDVIADFVQQNANLQKEITAAREFYNDVVGKWNSLIYVWPKYKIVAAKQGYTTRIPFIASKETKEAAKDVFLKE